ncbi:MAG: hypothetical protein KGO96_11170 [Elusimicrobia bacterium]|nr:hypothetical protein [Elusimicrobiota bacterium]MDE2426453.1 hypothetical protein [Elusimicrobiota bacterium]
MIHYTRTGTFEDLFGVVVSNAQRRLESEGARLPRKPRLLRALLEAPLIAAGGVLAAAMERLPAETALGIHERVMALLSGALARPLDAEAPALVRARAAARRLAGATGRQPALLALISHPPVVGELAAMNFDLARQALLALRAVRGGPCRPRLLVAVDAFALDTASLWQEGLYAGFMGRYHLGLDRLAFSRGCASRRLLGRAAWAGMGQRLLTLLRRGGEAGMVLAGGVPSTTRALYAAREWAQAARRHSPLQARPQAVLPRLRALPGFAGLEATAGRRVESVWRLAELYAMAVLSGILPDRGGSCVEAGRLDEAGRRAMLAYLDALGLDAGTAENFLSLLSEELARETPFRRRFFRVLAGRVLRSRPVVLIPIVHRGGASPGVDIKEAWILSGLAKGMISVAAGPAAGSRRLDCAELAQRFVSENFS